MPRLEPRNASALIATSFAWIAPMILIARCGDQDDSRKPGDVADTQHLGDAAHMDAARVADTAHVTDTAHAADGADVTAIAIYSDRGCWEESTLGLRHMFEWMGYSVSQVSAADIEAGALDRYRLVAFPGGDMRDYSNSLGSSGREMIRQFIQAGGAYLGICAGAYYAASNVIWRSKQLSATSLGLFEGTASGPLDSIIRYPRYEISEIKLQKGHPITQSSPDTMRVLYSVGPRSWQSRRTASPALPPTPAAGSQPWWRFLLDPVACF